LQWPGNAKARAFAYSTVPNDFFPRDEFSNRERTPVDTNERNLIRVHSRLRGFEKCALLLINRE
jgi:hypothetical protein